MSAKDRFHAAVKQALILEGWTITADPLLLRYGPTNLKIDLNAEKMIGAERGIEEIAIEIKSFLDPSTINDFHGAVGQYLHYKLGFTYNDWNRKLFLAVPAAIYAAEFHKPLFQDSIRTYGIKIITYTSEPAGIEQWIE